MNLTTSLDLNKETNETTGPNDVPSLSIKDEKLIEQIKKHLFLPHDEQFITGKLNSLF
jgi:hypothetical protein